VAQSNVVVVGAGPVGFVCALGLAQAGIRVTVLEAEPAIVDSPRASGYHWAVLPGLARLGILEDAERIGLRCHGLRMMVPSMDEHMDLHLDSLEGITPYPYMVTLGQNKLAEIAKAHLQRLPGTEVIFNTRVTGIEQDDKGVTVQTASPEGPREFRAGWVIGADGGRSTVRETLGLSMDGMTWPERFVATNIRFDFARHGYWDANWRIDPQYGNIVMKLDETNLHRCTFSEDASLPETGIVERIRAYFDAVLPGDKQYELVQYSPYRMHQRTVSSMRVGRVVLAGDAAHITNPTGGMGLTSGLFDSYVLYEALAAVIQGEVGDEVLDRYSEERRRVFMEQASPQASAFKKLVYNCTDPDELARHVAGLRAMSKDKDLQRQVNLETLKLETPSLVPARRARSERA
jgi:3-(3-hydroxy-phenyl)propionate hydroxylase/6-hydroxy-3-succinoylpyridine 3-monooxygenase